MLALLASGSILWLLFLIFLSGVEFANLNRYTCSGDFLLAYNAARDLDNITFCQNFPQKYDRGDDSFNPNRYECTKSKKTYTPDSCSYEFALKHRNVQDCGQIAGISDRLSCVSEVLGIKQGVGQVCVDAWSVDDCLAELAREFQDPSYCTLIREYMTRTGCLVDVSSKKVFKI